MESARFLFIHWLWHFHSRLLIQLSVWFSRKII
uniref:Uncharacterized protein n=1 Tax=Rhizophora mucronata TaxID=61149 RepID=A0A2P2J7U0_RHIMU